MLYLQGYSQPQIAEKLDISSNTLKTWIHQGSRSDKPWRELLESRTALEQEEHVKEMLEEGQYSLDALYELGSSVIFRSLLALERNQTELSDAGIHRIAQVLNVIDAKRRAEADGEDSVLKMTLNEARENLEHHPFLDKGAENG